MLIHLLLYWGSSAHMQFHMLLYWGAVLIHRECSDHMLIHLLLYWGSSAHMFIHLVLYWGSSAHMLFHLLLYWGAVLICSFICCSIGSVRLISSFICCPIGSVGLICSFICHSIGSAGLISSFICCSIGSTGLICSFICRSIENVGLMCSFICCSIGGSAVLICTYSICCYVGEFLTFPSICFLPVVYVFSHAQGAGQEVAAARTACATLCAERSDASTIARGSSAHCIGRLVRRIRRRRPASVDRRAEGMILTVDSACTRMPPVMVHVHGERDGFTSAVLRGASTSASTASVPW